MEASFSFKRLGENSGTVMIHRVDYALFYYTDIHQEERNTTILCNAIPQKMMNVNPKQLMCNYTCPTIRWELTRWNATGLHLSLGTGNTDTRTD